MQGENRKNGTFRTKLQHAFKFWRVSACFFKVYNTLLKVVVLPDSLKLFPCIQRLLSSSFHVFDLKLIYLIDWYPRSNWPMYLIESAPLIACSRTCFVNQLTIHSNSFSVFFFPCTSATLSCLIQLENFEQKKKKKKWHPQINLSIGPVLYFHNGKLLTKK